MRGRITIAGLGPAGPDLVTAATLEAIAAAPTVRLRTRRHPAAEVVGPSAVSYDDLYERHDTFGAVYDAIVEDLVRLAAGGDVLYLVPGAPTVAEDTVRRLCSRDDVDCHVLAAMSFLDLAWARLGVDPVEVGVRIVDGHRFATSAAGVGGAVLVAQCSSRAVLSDVKLAVSSPPEEAVLLHHLGLPDEQVVSVAWADIDRTLDADHLTSLYVPDLTTPPGAAVARFDALVRHLRDACPWDRRQTHGSLRPFLVEETYETIEALDAVTSAVERGVDAVGEPALLDDAYGRLEEELGDLLFQIVFHATLAAEQGRFGLDEVAEGIHDKLVRRHPHVFEPDADRHPSWEELKAGERRERGDAGDDGALARLAPMPTLPLAAEIASKVARAGFDWSSADEAWAKFDEEVAELREATSEAERRHELGDVLFTAVTLALHLDVEPDTALREALARFRARFGELERVARRDGVELASLDAATMLERWHRAKATVDG